MNNLIDIENLYFSYGNSGKNILKALNFQVKKGEVVGIVGLSGSGKSTLLYVICGIIPKLYRGKLEGEVKLWGENVQSLEISDISKKIGIVFQDPDTQLFSPTVEDEIAFGPENLCVDPGEIGLRIEKTLKIVNMEKYRYENPNNLSGGEKQLIALASVLAMEPEVLLFDEVLAQIDSQGKERIRNVIIDLKDQGKTMVLVDHDLENLKAADRIMELKEGKLIEFKGW